MIFRRLALFLALVLSFWGCADNTLGGSLADFYDTKFDGVRARLYEDELAVEYYRDNGEVPVRIAGRGERWP